MRRRERPRKGWKEKVERELQVLGVRRWRELVTDRKKWKDIGRQAKAHYGLYRQLVGGTLIHVLLATSYPTFNG